MVLAKKRASRSKRTAKSLVKAHDAARKIVPSRQGNGTWSHKLPTKNELKANGRTKGRNLVQWFSPGKAEQALLAIVYECNVAGIKLPFDNIAHRMNPGSSGESLKQHLPKLREELLEQGFAVPPRITKRKDDQTETRVCVRDDTHPGRERTIGWSETVDGPKDLLLQSGTPRPLNLNEADDFSMYEVDQQSAMDPEGDSTIENESNGKEDTMDMLAKFRLVPEPEAGGGYQGNDPLGNAADNSLSSLQLTQNQLPAHANFDDLPNIDEGITRILANNEFGNIAQENRTESSLASSLQLELAPWDPALLFPDNGGSNASLDNPMTGIPPDVHFALGLSNNGGWAADTVNPLDLILPTDSGFSATTASPDNSMAAAIPNFAFPIEFSETTDKSLPTDAKSNVIPNELDDLFAGMIPDFTIPLDPPPLSATVGGLEVLEQYLYGRSGPKK